MSEVTKVSYKKLWLSLVQNDMKKSDLRELAEISPSTMTKLNKNEFVALSVLVKICNVLKCDIGDIMEVEPEEVSDEA